MAKTKIDDLYANMFSEDVVDPSKKDTKVKTWYDIGNYALNYTCSKNLQGAIASGRITGIEGLGSTGKSLFGLSVFKDPKIDLCIVIDTEGGGNSRELMEFVGVPMEKIRVLKAHTFSCYKISKADGSREEVSDKDVPKKLETDKFRYVLGVTYQMKKIVDSFSLDPNLQNKNIVIVLDSIANLQSVRELSGGYDMGKRAQEIGIFFRTFDNALENTNIGFIYTNKLYTNFGNVYDPWKSVGGENVFYNSSLILRLATSSETDDVSESEIKADKKNKNTSLGNTYTTSMCRITKSRFGTKNRSCQYLIDSQFGLTRYSGLFRLLSDFKIIISPSSGWYALPVLWGEEKFRKKDFISLFRKDEAENVLKLQKALDAREEEIKNERREFNETGVADVEESQDLQDEEDILMEEILGETE